MADRLTYRDESGKAWAKLKTSASSKEAMNFGKTSLDRLAAYEDLGPVEEVAALKEATTDAWLQLRTATFSTDKGAADLAKFILSILPEAPNGAGKEQNNG